ncbi:hypothetical protein G7Y89_g8978 [Cudoniella acicularis]|uniref:Uncharacterized protein n=1 Tax=Cudoniella acicularis TaxID=354080 RepID=A0A8H4RGH5_9HELO|nr:hypothetical protein G7Y89_g8978 [Cudoniella acicularis]
MLNVGSPIQKPVGEIKVDVGVVYNRRCYPFRNGYEVRIPVVVEIEGKPSLKDEHRYVRREDFDTLLALSQVSHQMRKDIGNAFWKNIYINLDHWEYLLVDFMNERPAVAPGIKKLRMKWACDDGPADLDESIIDFCEYLSKHLVLDELIFVLISTPSVTRQIIDRGGDFATNYVSDHEDHDDHVANEGHLGNNDSHDNGSDDENNEGGEDDEDDEFDSVDEYEFETEEERRRERLVNVMQPRIENVLRPRIAVSELTDQELYLRARE